MIKDFLLQFDIYSWQILLVVFLAGFVAGVINTFAGFGTALNYLLFSILGIPINVANGTVRLGVIMQSISTSIHFYKKGLLDFVKGIYISIPVTAGSILGAEIAVNINVQVFERINGIVLILMLLLMFYDSNRWVKGKEVHVSKKVTLWHILAYFIIGIYGGFVHIGVGIFMIVALVWISGYDLVKATALKMFIVLVYTPFVFGIFALNGQIEYTLGIVTGIGNLLGGVIATKMVLKWGASLIRWSLIIVMIIFISKLLGFINF
ncbi:MAG: sulfite exporter TauE/SafE family protein [Bacteroidales bacterium]